MERRVGNEDGFWERRIRGDRHLRRRMMALEIIGRGGEQMLMVLMTG